MRKNETGPSKDISDRWGQEVIELIDTKINWGADRVLIFSEEIKKGNCIKNGQSSRLPCDQVVRK
jgi:hypothetical protein